MPERWLLRFAVRGDLRYLSHHETTRVVQRAATRAGVPLRYSQGYNPRPRLALLCPRPVAVAACEDPLLLGTDEPVEAGALRDALNAQAPAGMEFVRAEPQPGRQTPRPVRMHYALPVGQQQAAVRRRLAHLEAREAWPVERLISAKRGRRKMVRRTIDLRPLLAELDVHGGRLCWTAVARGDLWARPGEVLRVAGVDELPALADVVRTRVELDVSGERPRDRNGERQCRN